MEERSTAKGLIALAAVAFKKGDVHDAGVLFANAMFAEDADQMIAELCEHSQSLSISEDLLVVDDAHLDELASLSREISLAIGETCRNASHHK